MVNIAKHLKAIQQKNGESWQHQNTFIEMDTQANIAVASGVEFLFNCTWMKNDPATSVLVLKAGGELVVKNNFKIFSGAAVFINKNARLILGSGYINNKLSLHCFEKIEIGEDVAIADNVTIRDSDNHIITSNKNAAMTKPVRIGNHVWIGMNVTILKGVTIGDGAIVAAGAVVTKSIPPACLAAGVPAKVIKENVEWE